MVHGRPNEVGPLINSSFYQWVQDDLGPGLPRSDLSLRPLPDLSTNLLWLSPFLEHHLSPRYSDYIQDGRTHANYFFGVEQLFNCSDQNCVYHTQWHFHFMEVLDTDTTNIWSLADNTVPQFTIWVDQFISRRFPSIVYTYTSLIGDQDPYISLSRYF